MILCYIHLYVSNHIPLCALLEGSTETASETTLAFTHSSQHLPTQ